jgi:5-methylcytosine-specific restriction endonuclease McrA
VVTWDHFVPLAAGGSHVESNLVPCCGKCNSSKCDRDAIDWFRSKPFWSKKQESNVLRHLGKTLKNYNQVPLL